MENEVPFSPKINEVKKEKIIYLSLAYLLTKSFKMKLHGRIQHGEIL